MIKFIIIQISINGVIFLIEAIQNMLLEGGLWIIFSIIVGLYSINGEIYKLIGNNVFMDYTICNCSPDKL